MKFYPYIDYFNWSPVTDFTTNNNNRVDNSYFAYYNGHGSPFRIQVIDPFPRPMDIYLSYAGGSSHRGYGDRNCNFIVFHSCNVIPSPIERSDWWQAWVSEPDDIFDGLHQAIGFRTLASYPPALYIASQFGYYVARHYQILSSWINVVLTCGHPNLLYDRASIVYYPPAAGDTYLLPCADPPEGHQNLAITYMSP